MSIDQLTEDVGVACVPCRLLEQVHQHPAQVDRLGGIGTSAELVEIRGVEDDAIGRLGHLAADRLGKRVVAGGVIVWDLDIHPCESGLNPRDFGSRHVQHEPEQAGATVNGREARRGVIDIGDLADQGLPLVPEEGEQGFPFTAVKTRRFVISHPSSV